ncbi:Tetratricopeptide repeat family [Favolaschia claudopus]|uniref:Tetratricopeptide repeat family n=1 Tax=Favolaschia claudopus TaxID=2862362 RepID=A0AAW0B197_9AGAR
MFDPLTVTSTIVTLATFIKDLIELGEGIRSSIEKVGDNRRQIRELTEDIVRTLYDLASLTRGKEGAFRGPELLGALESLKAEMLYVHSKCLKISPIQLPGLRGIPSHLKAWRKRDDLEKKIARLRERANKCLLQFTAFSAARTEHVAVEIAHATLRMEQRLIVDNVENQVKTRRLEGLMASFMLESEFGQHVLRETVENISVDSSFQSLEYQYMSAQLRSLINLVQGLLACEDLSLVEGWESDTLSFTLSNSSTHTPSHALFHILGIIVAIHSCDHASLLDLLMTAINDLPGCFSLAGMDSEVIAWAHFEIDLHHYMAKKGYNIGTLPRIANALGDISLAHRNQLELDIAIELSQQSLALWVEVSHLLPDADNRIGYLRAMIIHAGNLLASDDKTTMLSAAQDAVSLARPMAKALAESILSRGTPLTPVELYTVYHLHEAFIVLAQVLSSLDRPLESYEAFVEGSRTACSLPICGHDPIHWGQYIDSFLDVICKVAEDGRLSLSMLADGVILFRDLARVYPKQYSFEFLRILHAFAYLSQQPHSSPSTEQIRLFLKPTHCAVLPAIDVTRSIPIDSSLLADAMRLFYGVAPERCNEALIQNILVAHFHHAIEALRVVVQGPDFCKATLTWVLPLACKALPRLLTAEYVALLQVLVEAGKSSLAVSDTWDFEKWEKCLAAYFRRVCKHAVIFGAVDEGIVFCQELVTYLEAQSDAHPHAIKRLQGFLALWVFLLCDAARFRDAGNLVKRKGSRIPEFGDLAPGSGTPHSMLWVSKVYILERVGRHKEALQLLREGVADRIRKFWAEGPTFDLKLYFLLPQLAVAWRQVGEPAKALEHAEKAVTACQDVDTEKTKKEEITYVQIHSLTTHSNCLAAVGRIDEGVESARKAVSLYTTYSPRGHTWNNIIFPIRGQELGGNAFFALSLRLLAVNDKEEALLNGRRATRLYRELVALAPRHLPTLARSLRHLASVLGSLGHPDEATAASEESVDILRKVVDPETYFLPILADALDELAGYFTKRGDNSGASTATAEAAEARTKFSSLPPEPEWLFMQVVDRDEDDDLNWWEWDAEQYYDALEGSASEDSAEADDSDDAGDPEFEDALSTMGIAEEEGEQTVAVETLDGKFSPIFVASADGADQASFRVQKLSDMDNSGITIAGEAAKETETQGTFTNILSKPVEIRLSMRSTLMDFLWWILLLILAAMFAVMYASIV